jgi:hypothetical protein
MTTQPLTRDLPETINALEIVEAEFGFQADRLKTKVEASTEQEREHFEDLQRGYEKSARYARILLNYHRGRMGSSRARQVASGIDRRGNSGAHTGDGE